MASKPYLTRSRRRPLDVLLPPSSLDQVLRRKRRRVRGPSIDARSLEPHVPLSSRSVSVLEIHAQPDDGDAVDTLVHSSKVHEPEVTIRERSEFRFDSVVADAGSASPERVPVQDPAMPPLESPDRSIPPPLRTLQERIQPFLRNPTFTRALFPQPPRLMQDHVLTMKHTYAALTGGLVDVYQVFRVVGTCADSDQNKADVLHCGTLRGTQFHRSVATHVYRVVRNQGVWMLSVDTKVPILGFPRVVRILSTVSLGAWQ